MKRIKHLFAGVILLLTLPTWRFLDWANVTLPFKFLITASIVFWAAFFVVLPLKLLLPKMNRWIMFLLILCLGSISWITGPFTGMTTIKPDLTHCGRMSYAGF